PRALQKLGTKFWVAIGAKRTRLCRGHGAHASLKIGELQSRCTLSALGRSGATAGVGCGDWMTVKGRQRNRERSGDRLGTGDEGSLDYPPTRGGTADNLC